MRFIQHSATLCIVLLAICSCLEGASAQSPQNSKASQVAHETKVAQNSLGTAQEQKHDLSQPDATSSAGSRDSQQAKRGPAQHSPYPFKDMENRGIGLLIAIIGLLITATGVLINAIISGKQMKINQANQRKSSIKDSHPPV